MYATSTQSTRTWAAAWQIACKVMDLIKLYSSSKKQFLSVPLEFIFKYAYTHRIVHLTYFDYTLKVLQNFEKTM